eukprot:3350591-Rhodomonas_salina.2
MACNEPPACDSECWAPASDGECCARASHALGFPSPTRGCVAGRLDAADTKQGRKVREARDLVALALGDEEDELEVDGEGLLVEFERALDLVGLARVAEHEAVQHQQLQLQQRALGVLLQRLPHQILHERQVCTRPTPTPGVKTLPTKRQH